MKQMQDFFQDFQVLGNRIEVKWLEQIDDNLMCSVKTNNKQQQLRLSSSWKMSKMSGILLTYVRLEHQLGCTRRVSETECQIII